ncbi:MAG: hypothetical protein KGY42_03695 [Desulfobacterales bacterium]|nr:hypothetical protein [Desulfobacterales bacterium]MBS3755152.1 hypothetical protein [Desulfobacterales bacterium]
MTDALPQHVVLDFGGFVLRAELFDTAVARRFAGHLPYRVSLTHWDGELYGPIGRDLGEENPVADISPGGLAYTNQGHLVCIFFGQKPAWPVEHIGQIPGDHWRELLEHEDKHRLEIRAAD